MELLAKLEEEEGGQDLTREQLRSVILVLGVVLIDAMVVGRNTRSPYTMQDSLICTAVHRVPHRRLIRR